MVFQTHYRLHHAWFAPMSFRAVTWMDTYGQQLGSFRPEQEQQLRTPREELAALLAK